MMARHSGWPFLPTGMTEARCEATDSARTPHSAECAYPAASARVSKRAVRHVSASCSTTSPSRNSGEHARDEEYRIVPSMPTTLERRLEVPTSITLMLFEAAVFLPPEDPDVFPRHPGDEANRFEGKLRVMKVLPGGEHGAEPVDDQRRYLRVD